MKTETKQKEELGRVAGVAEGLQGECSREQRLMFEMNVRMLSGGVEHSSLLAGFEGKISETPLPVHAVADQQVPGGCLLEEKTVVRRKRALSPERAAILRSIELEGPSTPRQLFDRGVATSHEVARVLVSKMARQAQLAPLGDGRYDLPSKEGMNVPASMSPATKPAPKKIPSQAKKRHKLNEQLETAVLFMGRIRNEGVSFRIDWEESAGGTLKWTLPAQWDAVRQQDVQQRLEQEREVLRERLDFEAWHWRTFKPYFALATAVDGAPLAQVPRWFFYESWAQFARVHTAKATSADRESLARFILNWDQEQGGFDDVSLDKVRGVVESLVGTSLDVCDLEPWARQVASGALNE